MATQTLSNFDPLLKNVYRGPLVELLNQETYLIQYLQGKDAQNLGNFTGRQVIFPVHTARNRGRGGNSDGGALPTAGRQGSLDAIVTLRYFWGAIELTDQVIEQSQNDEGAFVRAMEFEMDGCMTDLKKDACRIGYGTGDGLLATIATNATSATQAVDSGQFIAPGDTVDVLTKADGTVKGAGLTVNSVSFSPATADSSTQTKANIVLSGSVVATTADGIYLSGDRNLETDGLRNIVATGRSLHGIDSSSNAIWDSNVTDALQVNANENLFMKLSQKIRQRSGQTPDRFLTSLGVQLRLAQTYQSQKRWNDDRATTIDGGYEVINISAGGKAVGVVSDVDCPAGTAFALNGNSLGWTQTGAPNWLPDPSGGIHWELKDTSTAGQKSSTWQAWARWYAAMYCIAPHRNGKLINLNDDIPVARV